MTWPLCSEDGAGTLAAAERCRDELDMWFAIDTLEYLRKGGRIGAAQAWLGSALQIKPILTLGEEITPVERGVLSIEARGAMAAALSETANAYGRLDDLSAELLGEAMHGVLNGTITTHEDLDHLDVPR